MLERHFQHAPAGERRPADEQFVADHADRVEIDGRGDRLALGLFRSHVERGADHRVRGREPGPGHGPGDAEVRDRHPAVGPEHEVGRLDVAVHDAAPVGGVQGVQRLGEQSERPGGREGAVRGENPVQRPAVDQLHHQVREAVTVRVRRLLLAVVVHVDDARVVQQGEHACLAAEAFGEHHVRQQRRVEDLHRHRPPEHRVLGPPDGAHPAAADALGQRVAPSEHGPPTAHARPRVLLERTVRLPLSLSRASRRAAPPSARGANVVDQASDEPPDTILQ